MATIKTKNENGRIYIQSPYDEDFVKKVKEIGGRWDRDRREWSVPEDVREQLRDLILVIYSFDINGVNANITVQYKAENFYDGEKIAIGKFTAVERKDRDRQVTFNNTIVVSGDFDDRGGSRKNPAVTFTEGTYLRSKISTLLYESLTDEKKSKLTIIKDTNKKEKLEEEKVNLIKRIAEIDEELKNLENQTEQLKAEKKVLLEGYNVNLEFTEVDGEKVLQIMDSRGDTVVSLGAFRYKDTSPTYLQRSGAMPDAVGYVAFVHPNPKWQEKAVNGVFHLSVKEKEYEALEGLAKENNAEHLLKMHVDSF